MSTAAEVDKVVTLTLNERGLPVPDQDPVQIKKDRQKLRWCADFDFQIEMDGYADITYSTGGTGCRFRATTGTFSEIRKYKYTITANGQANDPEVDIRP